MKLSKIALVAAFALTIAGPAAAVTSVDIAADVQGAISNGNVHVAVDGGTVTLFGWVDDAHSKKAAELAAVSYEGVDKQSGGCRTNRQIVCYQY